MDVIGGFYEMKRGSLKKVISLMLSLAMVLSTCFVAIPREVKAEDSVQFTVSADKQDLHRGDELTVSVDMSKNDAAYGLIYELYYDADKLEVISFKKGTAFEGAAFSSLNKSSEDNSVIATILETDYAIPNGNVMTITFKVLEGAEAGSLKWQPKVQLTTEGAEDMSFSNDTDKLGDLKVVVPATGISLNKATMDLAKGQSEKLEAVLAPAGSNSTIAWKSSDPSVATVSDDGTVMAKAVGKATIIATAEGKSASCEVNVTVPLNGISIIGDATTIKKGQTIKLSVVYDPEDTTDSKAITWKSSNEDVATIDQNGIVTAIADGMVEITATVGDKTATYKMTVQEVKLTSISIKEATTIHVGDSESLTVTYVPENTTDDKTVAWSSSDSSKVIVDGNGTVTAIGVGGADITAKVGNLTAVCHVTVDSPLKSIVPLSSSIDLVKNQTAKIVYTLNPEDTTDDKTITFSSSDSEVAEVDAMTGEVTAKKAGTATVTLTAVNGITAAVEINVTEIPIDTVVLDKKNAVVEKGEEIKLTAAVGPENTTDDDKTITWTSSDESVATISSNNGETVTVTATSKGGTATITATAWNGTKAECKIIVPIHFDSISLPENVTMDRGTTRVLDVIYAPDNATDEKGVIWTSDNEEIATVDPETGVITALKEGTANITATTTKTKAPLTSTTQVTVVEKHLDESIGSRIIFEEMTDAILKGQIVNMNDYLNIETLVSENQITDDITIEWSSSDEEIVSIDQSGSALGVKEGEASLSAIITAKDGSGNIVGTYTVQTAVSVKEIPLESIAFNKVITEMQVGATDTLGIIYNPENTTDLKDVEWTSSDANVLSVEDGRLTALKAGTAEITAKVGDKTVSCTILVKEVQSGKDGSLSAGTKPSGTKGTGKNVNKGIKTGDTANIVLYVALLLISMATLMIFWRKRNRRVGR